MGPQVAMQLTSDGRRAVTAEGPSLVTCREAKLGDGSRNGPPMPKLEVGLWDKNNNRD